MGKPYVLTRRGLFGLLAAAPVLPASLAAARTPDVRHLYDFAIAGAPYYQLRAHKLALRPGVVLRLRAEPSNPYDRHAVEVLTGAGVKLGYVPRARNRELAQLTSEGWTLRATITALLDKGGGPDHLVHTGYAAGEPIVRLTAARPRAPGEDA